MLAIALTLSYIRPWLEYSKVYDLEVTLSLTNHFVDMMASLGYLIP